MPMLSRINLPKPGQWVRIDSTGEFVAGRSYEIQSLSTYLVSCSLARCQTMLTIRCWVAWSDS